MSEDVYTDRAYNLLLMRLERWLDELSARGPNAVPEVYREMNRLIENDQGADAPAAYREPCIDFNHQKNYN